MDVRISDRLKSKGNWGCSLGPWCKEWKYWKNCLGSALSHTQQSSILHGKAVKVHSSGDLQAVVSCRFLSWSLSLRGTCACQTFSCKPVHRFGSGHSSHGGSRVLPHHRRTLGPNAATTTSPPPDGVTVSRGTTSQLMFRNVSGCFCVSQIFARISGSLWNIWKGLTRYCPASLFRFDDLWIRCLRWTKASWPSKKRLAGASRYRGLQDHRCPQMSTSLFWDLLLPFPPIFGYERTNLSYKSIFSWHNYLNCYQLKMFLFFPYLSISFDQARVTELEALLVQHVPLRRRPVAILEEGRRFDSQPETSHDKPNCPTSRWFSLILVDPRWFSLIVAD